MNKKTLSEDDISAKFITPAVIKAGWDEATQIRRQVYFTKGRIIVRGKLVTRGKAKRADYVLYYQHFPIALIEAKDNAHAVGDGMQQALGYAQTLDIPFVFSSNGDGFVFQDRSGQSAQLETTLALDAFPSPETLWAKYRAYKGLAPAQEQVVLQPYYDDGSGKEPRYYQRNAINATVEAIAKGQNRILLVMATGTGKTYTAFQIIWRLWKSGQKKRILYLADRNVLINQTMVNDFRPFGAAMAKLSTRSNLKQFIVPLPPLAEQQRIVAKVDELMALCDQLEAAENEREARRDRLVAASLHRIGTAPADEGEAQDEAQTAAALRQAAHFHLDHLPRLTTRAEHIKQLRQTILSLAVRGRLVPQDPNDEPATELLKRIQTEKARLVQEGVIPRSKSNAGKPKIAFELPSNWQAIRFDDVCNLVTSGSRGWAEYYADSGPKFVRAQNIRFGRLRLDDLACVNPPANSEGKRTQVQKGDLLVVITGAGVTNPALMDRDLGEAYVSQHVALLKPTSTSLSRWLLLCLMSGPGGRDELVERAYGAGKPGLNLDNVRSLNAPLPPLAEQHRIVAKVDELMALCDQLETQLATREADSRCLLEAVLRDALAPALEKAA